MLYNNKNMEYRYTVLRRQPLLSRRFVLRVWWNVRFARAHTCVPCAVMCVTES